MTKRKPPSEKECIEIVLADDHAIVREGLKSLLNAQTDMRVVGEAPNGQAALEIIRELSPDIVITDVSMPGLSGSELVAQLREAFPHLKMLALTVHEERIYLTQLLRAGVAGYVLKRAAASDLVCRENRCWGRYVHRSRPGRNCRDWISRFVIHRSGRRRRTQ